MSIKEIAEIVDIPEGSVKSGIFYMLKKMKVQLKDYTHVN
jgi:DNA-directed RNA polymerase specialized sigma24 family protein